MNSIYDGENPVAVEPASGVRVRKCLDSALTAKRDVSQPAHETCALPSAVLHSAPVTKPCNPRTRHCGVEAILANHERNEIRSTNWELFAIWAYVVFSFAGLFFCFYVILAKCRGTWPF